MLSIELSSSYALSFDTLTDLLIALALIDTALWYFDELVDVGGFVRQI